MRLDHRVPSPADWRATSREEFPNLGYRAVIIWKFDERGSPTPHFSPHRIRDAVDRNGTPRPLCALIVDIPYRDKMLRSGHLQTRREELSLAPGLAKEATGVKRDTVLVSATRISRGEEVVAADMGDTILLLAPEKGEYFGLDGVGKAVWDMLGTPATVREIEQRLADRFAQDPAKIREDLIRFVEDARDQGVLNVE